ncbi:lasso peptide biosynthesis B2 protein [Prauserella endophytica]|uniref:lasso peptide biosynthesis B2 protein n=1 Tax=Prauserella endophytica TaxID=1592324 RepID=UPI001E544932|nr:lasso peptide biosynthesis B2 protein [Prauserella endophytica]
MSVRGVVRFVAEVPRAVVTLALIERSLRTEDLPSTCLRLGVGWDLDSAAPPARERAVLPRRTRPAVVATRLVAACWPAGDTCLRRCLLIGHRLRELDPVLRIGVRREDGAFFAHSWLEIGGRSLDPGASAFATLGAAGR